MLAAAIAAALAALIAWRGARTARVVPATVTTLDGAGHPAQGQPVAAQLMAGQSPAVRVSTGHDINHARLGQPSGLRYSLWHLAARQGLGAHRQTSGDHGHPASGRPPRRDLQHRQNLPTRSS